MDTEAEVAIMASAEVDITVTTVIITSDPKSG